MTYTPPDKDEILQVLLAGMRSDLPEMDVSEGSPEWHFANNVAIAVAASMGNAENLAQAVNPLYSKLDFLSTLAGLWGLTRTPARAAADGEIQVNVSGSGSWLITQQFRSPDGFTYEATSAGSWTASDSSVDIPIDCNDTGAATTKGVGAVLTVLSPPGGMNSTGLISTDFATTGLDEETDEELRQRLTNRIQGQGNSGNRGDYILWMETIAGIAESYVFTEMRNSLSIEGVIFGPKTIPGQRWNAMGTLVTDAEDYINGTASTEGVRAVGQDYDCVEPSEQNIAVIDVTIDSDPNYGRDWGKARGVAGDKLQMDATPIPGTLDYIEVTDDPQPGGGTPDTDLKIGDRIAVNTRVAGATTYFHVDVRQVTNIVFIAGAPNIWRLYVDTPFTNANASGVPYDYVYPAGPTTEATVTAIEAVLDVLSPGDDANSSRWPIVSAEHPADLTEAALSRAVINVEVEGVRRHFDTTWNTPALPVTATTSIISGGALLAYTLRLQHLLIYYSTLNTS
jgi:uncharacterized phage protein gp47/JayE